MVTHRFEMRCDVFMQFNYPQAVYGNKDILHLMMRCYYDVKLRCGPMSIFQPQ